MISDEDTVVEREPTPIEIHAYHEAGHAVIGRSLGLVVVETKIMSGDPSGGIINGGVTLIDLDASEKRLGIDDLTELRALTFVAGAVAQMRVQPHRTFVGIMTSDGIGDLIALVSITAPGSVSQAVIDAANHILNHGNVLTSELEQAWDTCQSWMIKYEWVESLYVQVGRLVDTHWQAIDQEAHRLLGEVGFSSPTDA